MKKDLWIVLERDTYQMKLVDSAHKLGLDYEVRTMDFFSIKDGELFYENDKVENLPKVILLRSYINGQAEIHKYFEDRGVNVIDSLETVELINDKIKTHQALENHGIKQPKFIALNDNTLQYDAIVEKLGQPFIAKDIHGQGGSSVFMVESSSDYDNVLNKLANKTVILQQYIKESYGRDLRVFVIGGQAAPVGMLRTNDHSFLSNYSAGGVMHDLPLTAQQIQVSSEIANILGGKVISVDFLFKGDELYFCEANTNASFVNFIYPISDDIMKYVEKIINK